jgi:hypothetical protein
MRNAASGAASAIAETSAFGSLLPNNPFKRKPRKGSSGIKGRNNMGSFIESRCRIRYRKADPSLRPG